MYCYLPLSFVLVDRFGTGYMFSLRWIWQAARQSSSLNRMDLLVILGGFGNVWMQGFGCKAFAANSRQRKLDEATAPPLKSP